MSLVVGWQAGLEKNGRFSVFPKFRQATQGRHHAFKMIAASAGCTSAGGQKEFKLAQGLEKIQENPFFEQKHAHRHCAKWRTVANSAGFEKRSLSRIRNFF